MRPPCDEAYSAEAAGSPGHTLLATVKIPSSERITASDTSVGTSTHFAASIFTPTKIKMHANP